MPPVTGSNTSAGSTSCSTNTYASTNTNHATANFSVCSACCSCTGSFAIHTTACALGNTLPIFTSHTYSRRARTYTISFRTSGTCQ